MAIKSIDTINKFKLADQANLGAEFFSGSFNTRDKYLGNLDPYTPGYAFIFWTKLPTWVDENFPYFKDLTRKTFKSFDGLGDIDLGTGTIQHGFGANEYTVATTINKGNTDFSMTLTELSGLPLTKAMTFWVSGIRDPETGIATYPQYTNGEYGAKWHTGELLYVVTRPDANRKEDSRIIEAARYYTAVFPTRIPQGHLNFQLGSHDVQDINISFKGVMHMGPKVEEFAVKKMEEAYTFMNMGEVEIDPEK